MGRSISSETKGVSNWKGRESSFFSLAVLSAMASLLIMVGVLQYQWARQLSKAAEASIGSNLQPLMMGWHLDFYAELSAICIALQVGPDSGAGGTWDDYLRRYVDWSHVGINTDSVENIYANPDLIEDIYIWETSDTARLRLLRLNADAARIESSEVRKDLQPLLSRLLLRSSSLPVALRAWELPTSPAEPRTAGNNQSSRSAPERPDKTTQPLPPIMTGWQFDKNTWAIVHPIVNRDRDSLGPDKQQPDRGRGVNWIIVVLNRDYIQTKLLPSLTKRYFGGREGLEYRLAVIATGKTPRMIYSTDAGFPGGSHDEFDSKMNIFGPPPESVEGQFWHSVKNGELLRREEWRSFSALVWFPVIQYAPQDDPWILLLQHRSGPLEAIATNVWHRNLVVGGVVLLLLAANMGLVVFASQRKQKFAKVQMEFVASVSHELRTPLTSILSAAENIKDGFVEGKENLKFYGSLLTAQARLLKDRVDRILFFASTRSGKTQYALRPLAVSEILRTVRKNTAALLEEEGYTLDERTEPGLPCVLGDLSALCMCLQNFIANAVKYGGEDRWIGLSATCHETGALTREVRIAIHDHGKGISSSDLPHIFEPFYRSPKVVAAEIHGTGLGLALAKSIAEGLSGRISVISEVGVGSTFTLHLGAVEDKRVNSRAALFPAARTMTNE
jgi:signal transduction histidine kinase